MNPFALPIRGALTSSAPRPPYRAIHFPQTQTPQVTFLRTLLRHCKPQTKRNQITPSFQHPNCPNSGKKWTKDGSAARAGWALESQQFIFSGGGGGAHSWLHFDRELAFNTTGDTRNSQPSLPPSAFPRRQPQDALKQLQHH